MPSAGSFAGESEDFRIGQLQRMIEMQQRQLDAQAAAIRDLTEQLDRLRKEGVAAGQKPESAPTVRSVDDKVEVTLYGQVNRGVLAVNDGHQSDIMHVDNTNSSTRFGIKGDIEVTEDLALGAWIEASLQSNPSLKVSQDDASIGGDNLNGRHIEVSVYSRRFGRFSVGQGDTASNISSEVDLSGTTVIGFSDVPLLAGGIKFFDEGTGSLSPVTVSDVFDNMDGLSRRDRLRYDSPPLLGFLLSGSFAEEDAKDIALRYSGEFAGLKLSGALGFAEFGGLSESVDTQVSGSLSLLHEGVNVTFAAGSREKVAAGSEDPDFYYAKLGYQHRFFSTGLTSFALDFGRFSDVALDRDRADTYGAFSNHHFDRWNADLYLGYRNYELKRPGTRFRDIDAILGGGRLKF